MLLALTGGRIVFSDRAVFQIVRAGAPSSRVGVTLEALGVQNIIQLPIEGDLTGRE